MGLPIQNGLLIFFGVIFQVFDQLFHAFLKAVVGSKKEKLPPIKDEFLKESAFDLAAKIRTRQITSQNVVKAYIKRIETVNPFINVLNDQRFTAALEDAGNADAYIANSGRSPEEIAAAKPLLGVPFTTKNAIGIKDLLLNAGVVIKKSDRAKEDSDVVALLREAGGIPLCVTNVPEYCMWADSSNKLYGISRNPYDLCRIPGGSSGGEGAIVTSAASAFGVGNDIGGSIRIPSFHCGVFGHKPTKRIVSNRGQFPSSYRTDLDHFNVTGPISRHAKDLLPLMKILSGENESKLNLSQNVDLRKIKVYYTDDYVKGGFFSPLDTEMKDAVKRVVSHLEKVTGNKAQKIKFPVHPSNFTSMALSKYGTAKAPSFIQLITGKEESHFSIPWEFVKFCLRICKHTLHVLSYLAAMKYTSVLSPETVNRNNELTERLEEGMKSILGEDGVFIYPPQPNMQLFQQETILKFINVHYTSIFNILGYPSTQCPIGLSKDRLPLGVQVIGYLNNDRLTMTVAEEIERAFGGWVNPSANKV